MKPRPGLVVASFDSGVASFGLVAVRLGFNAQAKDGLAAKVFTSEGTVSKYAGDSVRDRVRRTQELNRWLRVELDRIEPDVVIAEEMGFPPDATAAVFAGLAWGVIAGQLEERRIPYVAAPAGKWRDFLIGKDTRKKLRGKTKAIRAARRARTVEREKKAHAAAAMRFPSLARAIETIPRSIRMHAYDALGVMCWGLAQPEVLAL